MYAQHRGRLRGLAAAITLDRSVADDVVQDAFAGLAGRIDSIDDPAAYLHRSVVNLSLKVLRRRGLERSVATPSARVVSPPEIELAWAQVAALPAQQRAVVVLRFWEDLSYDRIAEVMDVPVGTVKSSLHRALQVLRASWPLEVEA